MGKTCRTCGGWTGSTAMFDPAMPPTLCRCDGALSFAEAMALDPSEVEVHVLYAGDAPNWKWISLACRGDMSIRDAKEARFRRSRPKRSRVQEMAAKACPDSPIDLAENIIAQRYVEAIRSVCEYLRSQRTGYDFGANAATDVEREFLEKRL